MVDRENASLDPKANRGTFRMPYPFGEPVDLRLIVDHSIAEIFLSTGTGLATNYRQTPANNPSPWTKSKAADPCAPASSRRHQRVPLRRLTCCDDFSSPAGFEAVRVVVPVGQGELAAGVGRELVGEEVGDLGQDDAAVVAP